MTLQHFLQTLNALSGITVIVLGTLRLKTYLKRSFCC